MTYCPLSKDECKAGVCELWVENPLGLGQDMHERGCCAILALIGHLKGIDTSLIAIEENTR